MYARASAKSLLIAYLSMSCLLLASAISVAAVAVVGRWEVTLLKGTTTVSPASVGATQAEAWANCLTRIPQPSQATSGSVSYTCQTPKYKATATYSPDPIREALLTWGTPVQNEAGPITGYRIESAGVSTTVGLVNSYRFANLAPGTHCYTIRAIASLESEPTDPVCKIIP